MSDNERSDPIDVAVGARIRIRRQALKISQSALAEALTRAGPGLAVAVAGTAQAAALGMLGGAPVAVDVLVIDRAGRIVGQSGP